MTDPPTPDDIRVRPFPDVLRDFAQGVVLDEASLTLQEVVAAVRTHGKKGHVTLRVDVEPIKGSKALLVKAHVDAKTPKEEPVVATFFADEHGNLLRDDPDQLRLPLRRFGEPNLREADQQ